MAILGYGQKILSSPSWPAVLQGTGTPIGTMPDFVGQRWTDGVTMWDAVALSTDGWSQGGGDPADLTGYAQIAFAPLTAPPTLTEGLLWIVTE